MPPRIVILGAGPTGLGAALRCVELGYTNWKLYEKNQTAGGLAGSVQDSRGFSWDFGGHVFFSQYKRINRLVETLGAVFFIPHTRKAFIHLYGRHIPYPFQQHLDHLPKGLYTKCLLSRARGGERPGCPKNFKTWLEKEFGLLQCSIFFFPYNEKVWGYPLSTLSTTWTTQRISPPGQMDQQENWGPNSRFYYPATGGMGGLFRSLARKVSDFIGYNQAIMKIDPVNRTIKSQNGETDNYDILISTVPLTKLITSMLSYIPIPETVYLSARGLHWNSCTITGLGFKGPTENNVSWVYYPESQFSFYRVSALSSYAPNLVPDSDPERFSSLLCETTLADNKAAPSPAEVLDNIYNTRFVLPEGKKEPVTATQIFLPYAYPIPAGDREHHLKILHDFLESRNIFSRGRFGGWRYETGNMDHCLMQGMEVIDRVLLGKKETVYRMT